MNLQAVLSVVSLLPELITDIEKEVGEFKQGPNGGNWVEAAVAGIEKLAGDVLPLLKSGAK